MCSAAVSKMQVLLRTHLEREAPPASKSPDVSPLSQDGDGEWVLSPAAATGGDPTVPAKPLKIHSGHRET